ncbi:MAG TPA: universal stress protein [Herpetosiphonaceae bacterium]
MSETTFTAGGRVLVALDGSPASATALPIALTLADQLAARLEILHVVSERPSANDIRRRLRLDADPWLDIELRIAIGKPVDTILQASAEPDMILLVMTTHGRIVEPGRAFGRVAQAVAAEATRPIVMVRPEVATDFMEHGGSVRHVLLPLDGTPTTAALLRPATALASRLAASIDLLYVVAAQPAVVSEPGSMGVPRYLDQPQHEWPEWSDEMIDRFARGCAGCPSDVPIRMFLARGDIGQEIVRFASEHHVDVVVVARRSHLEPGRARVLRAVLRHTPCPLLLVGAPDGDGCGALPVA